MLDRIRKKVRKYFGFSSQETNGLLFLIPLILLVMLAPQGIKQLLLANTPDSSIDDQEALRAWYEASKTKLKIEAEKETEIHLSFFNPNLVSKEKLIELGFRESVAKRIIKYRLKGGEFRKKEDLQKIYGINKKLLMAYDAHIVLPPVPKRVNKKSPDFNKAINEMVKTHPKSKYDINLCDTTQLQMVRGIGPVLSNRIIKYRESLGGFLNNEQVKEVYGLEEEVYIRMLDNFNVIISAVKKININQDSAKHLARHPYISYKSANAIVKYRKQHGDYKSIDELKKIYLISDSIYNRMNLYIRTSK